jgi:hypothetical protein
VTETVRAVGSPLQSVIAGLYDGADLADAFAIMLPDVIAADIDQLARAVLGNPSWWFRALLACRDALVAPFGVKTSAQLRAQLQTRRRRTSTSSRLSRARQMKWSSARTTSISIFEPQC